MSLPPSEEKTVVRSQMSISFVVTYFCGPFYLTHPVSFSLWEEIGVPGENPRLSAERWLLLFSHEDWVQVALRKFSLRFGPTTLEVKGKCANHFTTEAPCIAPNSKGFLQLQKRSRRTSTWTISSSSKRTRTRKYRPTRTLPSCLQGAASAERHGAATYATCWPLYQEVNSLLL